MPEDIGRIKTGQHRDLSSTTETAETSQLWNRKMDGRLVRVRLSMQANSAQSLRVRKRSEEGNG